MQSLQSAVRRSSQSEARGVAEMPVVQEGTIGAPPVRMNKLTETRAITPHKWVHPDEER
jgi:hypothetical protein